MGAPARVASGLERTVAGRKVWGRGGGCGRGLIRWRQALTRSKAGPRLASCLMAHCVQAAHCRVTFAPTFPVPGEEVVIQGQGGLVGDGVVTCALVARAGRRSRVGSEEAEEACPCMSGEDSGCQ